MSRLPHCARAACLSLACALCVGLLWLVPEVSALEFSADRVLTQGKFRETVHINAMDDRWRLEFMRPQDGVSVVIVRSDRQRVWMIQSQRKVYREGPILPQYRLQIEARVDGELTREYVGEEMLHGHLTELFEVRVERGGRQMQFFQWVTKAHGFPIKTVHAEEDWSEEYRNLRFVGQSPWLFELPKRLDPVE